MSKYIDADLYVEMQIYDDEHEEWGVWNGTIKELLDQWTEQGCPPIIEVSEEEYEWCHNCKEYDKDKHCCHRWNKVIRQTVAEMRNISEDCISRAEALKAYNEAVDELVKAEMKEFNLGDFTECSFNTTQLKLIARKIEDAPSVTTEQSSMVGEWKRHPIPENRAWDICTACGTGCRRRHYGFNEDGTEWVEQANYPFCPNCGAKMKGIEDCERK